MSSYEQLSALVEDQQVRLIYIEAVPRSVSTALARALNESDTPSICVNEPFNRMRHDSDEASGRILDAALPVLNDMEVGGPLTVITKNMARNLTQPIFQKMVDVSDRVVWAIRDPIYQIGSLLTRIANDITYGSGMDVLPQGGLTDDQIRRASDFLQNGPKSKDFSKTSWQSIGEHFDSGTAPNPSLVVDGWELTNMPEAVLRYAAKILAINYTARMTNGWREPFVNANTGYSETLDDASHAWTGDAVTSRGIKKVNDVAIETKRLPKALQKHIEEVALPTYRKMMSTGRRF